MIQYDFNLKIKLQKDYFISKHLSANVESRGVGEFILLRVYLCLRTTPKRQKEVHPHTRERDLNTGWQTIFPKLQSSV